MAEASPPGGALPPPLDASAAAALAADAPRAHLGRIVQRSLQIALAGLSAFATFLGSWWRLPRGEPQAVVRAVGIALVHFCSALGATFIKVGQIASTRGDLLPRPLIEELSRLQDRVPPFPFAQVREAIERDLGRPLEAVFRSFECEPVAAASVSQVHRAVLAGSGADVAVKVRRPDIEMLVGLDRSILIFLGRVLERIVPSMRLISLHDSLRHFCDAVALQLRFDLEAANNARFTANFADDADIHFPVVYPEASASGVLTMEFIDGVHESGLEGAGVDPRRIAAAGMRCVCRMIFLHGFVHADLHPGNLRFFAPGRIVLLDLGLVGALEPADRLSAAELLFAFATGDGKTVARLFHDNAPYRATPDYGAYEAEMSELVEAVHRLGMGNIQVTVEIGRLFDVLRRHGIRARSHMTMVNLALMTAEGLGKRLAPDLSLADEALPYLAEALHAATPVPPVS